MDGVGWRGRETGRESAAPPYSRFNKGHCSRKVSFIRSFIPPGSARARGNCLQNLTVGLLIARTEVRHLMKRCLTSRPKKNRVYTGEIGARDLKNMPSSEDIVSDSEAALEVSNDATPYLQSAKEGRRECFQKQLSREITPECGRGGDSGEFRSERNSREVRLETVLFVVNDRTNKVGT